MDLPEREQLRSALTDYFGQGEGFESIASARRWAKQTLNRRVDFSPGSANAKALEETIEESLVAVAQDIVAQNEDPCSTYHQLVGLYQRQPKLAMRSSGSVERQAYSTPLPIAYLATAIASVDPDQTVYEPAAGHGALLLGTNQSQVIANEIEPNRAQSLQRAGYQTTTADATTYQPDAPVDAILANPPFGSVRDFDGDNPNATKEWSVEGIKTRQIDQAICLNSLACLKDEGKAVLIIGGVMGKNPEVRSDRYNHLAQRRFYKKLYDNYNVTDHFSMSGKLYERQGAAFPIDVIAINGRGQSARSLPAADVPPLYDSFEQLETEVLSHYVPRLDTPLLDADGSRTPVFNANDSLLERRGSSPRPKADWVNGRISESTALEDSMVAQRGSDGRTHDSSRGTTPGNENVAPRTRNAPQRSSEGSNSSDGESRSNNPAQSLLDGQFSRSGTANQHRNFRSASSDRSDESSRMAGRNSSTLHPHRRLNSGEFQTMPQEETLQVKYNSASNGQSLNCLVPANMAASLQDSLDQLVEKHGDIDNFVAERLQWSRDELFERLSAEQIDAVALGLDNRDNDAETILGDQTGIGKGRVVAAMIRAAKLDDQTPVFVTENANLYRDMLRDLEDIGESVNPYFTDTQLDLETLEGDRIKYSAREHQQEEAEILRSGSLGDRDCIFTTYSQMQTVRGEEPDRRQILRQFAPQASIIFDESHNAGGSGAGLDYNSKGAPNRAAFARELKKSAQQVFSSSATYAKNPEVMDLYNRTDMGKAVHNLNSLVSIVSEGGVPLQQALASQLSQAGQYVRRERSYEGVDFDNQMFGIDRELVDSEAKAMGAILAFDQAKNDAISDLDKDLKAQAKALSPDNSTGGAGAESTNFTSLMHNYLSVSNLAHKQRGVVDLAVKSLEDEQKPVIALSNTMGSFIEQYATDHNLDVGDDLDASMGDLLERYLERSRDVSTRDSEGHRERRRLTDDELGRVGVQAYDEAQEAIQQCDFTNLPISPIDAIRFELEEQGYRTGEVTGRTEKAEYERSEDGLLQASYDRRSPAESSKAGKAEAVDRFNNGDIDALIVNRSGATGISLHASEKFADQRRRHLIMAQPDPDVNRAVQMFGRVHRTGQVQPPHITIGAGENPSEKRAMAVLMKKLASLNANTTASREGQIDFSNSTDFLNEIGDRVVEEIVAEDSDLEARLDYPLRPEIEGTARRVTGRMAALPLAEQEELFERIESEYQSTLEREMTLGNNPLEAEKLDLDAKTVATVEVQPADPDSNSPFTDAVVFEVMDVQQNRQPLKTLEAMNAVHQRLGLESIETPEDFDREQVATAAQDKTEELKQAVQADARRWQDERAPLFKKPETQARFRDNIAQQSERLQNNLSELSIGQTVKIKDPSHNVFYGVITDHHRKNTTKNQNPVAPSSVECEVAVADSARLLKIPHSKIGDYQGKYQIRSQEVEDFEQKDIYSLFDERQGTGRELRGMFTGNIVRAAERFRSEGKVVNYTDDSGDINQGILVNKKFDLRDPAGIRVAARLEKMPIKLPQAEDIERWTHEYNHPAQTRDGRLGLELDPDGENFVLSTAKSKSSGGDYYLDPKLLEAAGGEFHSVSNRMEITFEPQRLEAVVERLNEKGGLYAAPIHGEEAREMLNIELPDLDVLDSEHLEEARAALESEESIDTTETATFEDSEDEPSESFENESELAADAPEDDESFDHSEVVENAGDTRDLSSSEPSPDSEDEPSESFENESELTTDAPGDDESLEDSVVFENAGDTRDPSSSEPPQDSEDEPSESFENESELTTDAPGDDESLGNSVVVENADDTRDSSSSEPPQDSEDDNTSQPAPDEASEVAAPQSIHEDLDESVATAQEYDDDVNEDEQSAALAEPTPENDLDSQEIAEEDLIELENDIKKLEEHQETIRNIKQKYEPTETETDATPQPPTSPSSAQPTTEQQTPPPPNTDETIPQTDDLEENTASPSSSSTQTERVNAVAPVMERYLTHFAQTETGEVLSKRGQHYTGTFNLDNQHLTITDNQDDRTLLSATRNADGTWQDEGSDLSEEEASHFTQTVAPAVDRQIASQQQVAAKVQQQDRVERIAPTLVKHLKLSNRLSIEGERFSSKLDPTSATLSLTQRGQDRPCLVAQYDENGRWRDRGSSIDESTLDFFEQKVSPKVNALLEQRQQDVSEKDESEELAYR